MRVFLKYVERYQQFTAERARKHQEEQFLILARDRLRDIFALQSRAIFATFAYMHGNVRLGNLT